MACHEYIAIHGPTTVTNLIDNVKSSYGKKYRSAPVPKELGNNLRLDKRFIVIEKANHSDIWLWGLSDDER